MADKILIHKSKTGDHADIIKEHVRDKMLPRLIPEECQFSYDVVVDQYWTPKDREIIDRANDIMWKGDNNNYTFPVSAYVTIAHEALPEPFSVPVGFTVSGPDMRNNNPWPKALMQTATGERLKGMWFMEIAERVAMNAVDKGLLLEVTEWLLENCNTHQQAAWLLHGWETIIRRAGLRDISYRCDEKSRSIPALPVFMRQKLRYLNVFLAKHELLETWDKPIDRNDPSLCTIRLSHVTEVNHMIGEQRITIKLR